MVKLCLNNYIEYNGSYICGYAFYGDVLLKGVDLYSKIVDSIKNEELDLFLNKINGSFSLVIQFSQQVYLISDKIRSYPLYYQRTSKCILVTNSISDLCLKLRYIDSSSELQYLSCGYLSFDKTLFSDIYQVASGMYVTISSDIIMKVKYHNFTVDSYRNKCDLISLYSQATTIIKSAFSRILQTIGNSQIVIPLSGGYDSRLIACLCKEFKLKNVICYTYGRENSYEVEVSKKVADKLGYKWIFVEYTREKVLSLVKNDTSFLEYISNYNSIVSFPHFQDFLAVKEMKENKMIDEDSVIIPGHSGDVLGGSKIPKSYDKNKLEECIYDNFYDLLRHSYNKKSRNVKNIRNVLKNSEYSEHADFLQKFECIWFCNSKIPNFLVNSMRVYEFFGYKWRLPFWDDEFVHYWYSIDWKLKKDSKLYNNWMFESFFNKYNVAYYKTYENKLIGENIKKFIPSILLDLARRLYTKVHSDFYNFNSQDYMIELFKNLNKELINHFFDINKAQDINSVAAIYFINKIKSECIK